MQIRKLPATPGQEPLYEVTLIEKVGTQTTVTRTRVYPKRRLEAMLTTRQLERQFLAQRTQEVSTEITTLEGALK